MSLTSAKTIFVNDILEIFEFEAQQKDNPGESRKRIAVKLANAIDKFVRAGDVEVTTTGTATTQTGIGKMK